MQLAGWIPTTDAGIAIPGWMGTWFALFPSVETLGAQALAAAFVVGSYYAAEYVKVRRPQRRGQPPARLATAPPETITPPA
jgi:high-affinity iron transporter